MNTLVDWLGKTEDITIVYDAGILKTDLLEGNVSLGSDYPAIIYPTNDNFRDIADVAWEENVPKADRIDYMMSVCSGAIAGLIDIFYVGEFSLDRAQEWGKNEVNDFVLKVAKSNGFKEKGLEKEKELERAVRFMEDKFGIAADSVTNDFGGGLQHHLRDFSHHFSIGGWLCSMFTQFTGKVIGTDEHGVLRVVELKDKTFIGKNFEEKLVFGTLDWFFHMVSDMAGSNKNAGKGTGIPGPIVSLIKELSVLPCFKDAMSKEKNYKSFRLWISKLFNGTLLKKLDENGKIQARPFDLRTEIGVLHEIGKQFVPVLINECLVRSIYFARRLYVAIQETEIHSISDLQNIDPAEILPFNNRIVRRMVTVASGTFTAIDFTDAAIRAAIKNQGINAGFVKDFAVRVNVVGVGRFIIACKMDWEFITEDIRKAKEERDRIEQEYEKLIADLKCLSLDFEQMRVLFSLERLSVVDDIMCTRNADELHIKAHWRGKWEQEVLKDMHISRGAAKEYFMTREDIADYFRNQKYEQWWYLIAMESITFKPYYPLLNDERNKDYKKAKYQDEFDIKNFCKVQSIISRNDLIDIQKEYKRAGGIISGVKKNVIIGAVGTTAAVVATGGLAFAFAPVIAPVLVGEAAAGLSGAALVHFSLAAIGGGAIAAGGLGMAGGTAIIAGGGALIGMIGGAGVSAATTISLMADDGYVLNQCYKLLTFCKAVLLDKFLDYKAIIGIRDSVDTRILDVQNQIKEFSQKSDEQETDEQKKERKLKAKIAEKNIRYLKRCSDELHSMTKSITINDEPLALPSGDI